MLGVNHRERRALAGCRLAGTWGWRGECGCKERARHSQKTNPNRAFFTGRLTACCFGSIVRASGAQRENFRIGEARGDCLGTSQYARHTGPRRRE